MTRLRDIRLLPVVIIAIAGVLALKVSGLAIDGRYIFGPARFSQDDDITGSVAKRVSLEPSWAEEMFNFPSGRTSADPADVTGSAAASKPKDVESPLSKPIELKPIEGEVVLPDSRKTISESERAVLERLQERRKELEARAREIEIRENLLKSTEKKLNERSEELKAIQTKARAANQQREEEQAERYKGLVTMYESMKPKDAAKILDRLEMHVLYDVVSKINPRKMADILAQMSPEVAERLTVEIAARAGAVAMADQNADLPKIEGRPMAPPASAPESGGH